jgi:hypothetical protein
MTNPKSPIRNRVDIRVDIGLTRTWPSRYVIEKIGGRGGARTPDPLLAKQVLSQLSYTPTNPIVWEARPLSKNRLIVAKTLLQRQIKRDSSPPRAGLE